MIIKRSITAGLRFQFIIKIKYDLGQRHFKDQLHPGLGQVALVDQDTTLAQAKRHDIADILGFGDDLRLDKRFFDAFGLYRVGKLGGIVHCDLIPIRGICNKAHVGHRGDHGLVEFPLQSFLDDLHVEHTEKAATKTKTQRLGSFQFEGQGSIVQLQFVHAVAQLFKLICIHREDSREHHRFHFLKTPDHFGMWVVGQGDGIPHFYFLRVFYTGDNISYIARLHFRAFGHLHFQDTHFIGFVFLARAYKFYFVAFFDRAIQDTVVDDDATKTIEHAVEDQRLQGCIGISFGGWYAGYDRVEYFVHTQAGTTAGMQDLLALAADQVDDLVFHFFDHGAIHIDLVDHRDDLQVVVDGEVEVRNSLRLYPLGGIHQQQAAFAGGQGTAYFIAEVYVTGGIDQVEGIFLPVVMFIVDLYRVALDGDPLLPLQVHIIQHLVHHFAVADRAGAL